VPQLVRWLDESGYDDIEVVDTCLTTTAEQRSTGWMTFESLQEALDPANPELTVEGWPAPRRVVVTATAPAPDTRRGH
jgi:tRNA (mo5U34)-methyltransferase